MITKERIKNGLEAGFIKIVDGDMARCGTIGTVCQIGNNQFYFGGTAADENTPEDYLKNTPIENIIDEIYETLEDFKNNEDFIDEYLYYHFYLQDRELNTGKKYYYKFISYSDGSGHCEGLRINYITEKDAEHRRKCGEIWEKMDIYER